MEWCVQNPPLQHSGTPAPQPWANLDPLRSLVVDLPIGNLDEGELDRKETKRDF
jgi:hypothetical protein